ncbi:trypsin-like peptidase domain-containing protein, partial [Planctomycetota bacterium]
MKKYLYYLLLALGCWLWNGDKVSLIFSQESIPSESEAEVTSTDDKEVGTFLFKKVDPSVVTITHEYGQGSGFIISSDGYIISNGHVIMGNIHEEGDPKAVAKRITITLSNEKKYKGQVIGHSLDPDCALIKIEADEELSPVELGDSDTAKAGENAYVLGTAGGLKRTLTAGIISNVERTDLPTFTKIIQTDAPINHGNSGGPLFNEKGEVLGITTYKRGWGSEGLGFVIPINVAKTLKDHFLKYGYFRRVDVPLYIIQPLYDELAQALGVKEGVLADFVEPDSLAAQAGLATGDIIIKMNDQPISACTEAQVRDLNWQIVTQEVGTPIKFHVLRPKGVPVGRPKDDQLEEHVITATLIEDEPAIEHQYQLGEIKELRYDELGLGVKKLTMLTYYYYNLPKVKGVRITNVGSRSPASKAGLRTNDIITHLQKIPIENVDQFQNLLEKHLAQHSKYIHLTVLTTQQGKHISRTAIKPYYDLADKKVILILPIDDSEYFDLIKRILVENGAEITIASKIQEIALGKDRKIKVDRVISDLSIDNYHGIIFIGG